MLADISIVLIVILFILIGVKRGFAKSVLGIIGLIVSFFAAQFLADFLANAVYNAFLKQTVVDNVNTYINTSGVDYALTQGFSALPDWANGFVSGTVSFLGGNFNELEQGIRETTHSALTTTATTIENTIQTVSVTIFDILFLIILFIVLYIIVRKLIKLVSRLFKLPIIKQVNSVLGGIFGAAEGILIVFLAVNIFATFEVLSNPDLLSNGFVDGWLFNLLRLNAG